MVGLFGDTLTPRIGNQPAIWSAMLSPAGEAKLSMMHWMPKSTSIPPEKPWKLSRMARSRWHSNGKARQKCHTHIDPIPRLRLGKQVLQPSDKHTKAVRQGRNCSLGGWKHAALQHCRRPWIPLLYEDRTTWALHTVSLHSFSWCKGCLREDVKKDWGNASGPYELTYRSKFNSHLLPGVRRLVKLWDGCLDISQLKSLYCYYSSPRAEWSSTLHAPWPCWGCRISLGSEPSLCFCPDSSRFRNIKQSKLFISLLDLAILIL